MHKYGKWALTLGLLAATPGFTLADAAPGRGGPAARQTRADYNQQMADRIANALRKEKLTAYDVEIEYKDGIATIKGTIVDKKQKQRVREVIKSVDGVTQVDDTRLLLLPKKSLSDRFKGPVPGSSVQQADHTGSPRDRRVQQVSHEDKQASMQNNQQIAEQIGAALSSARLDGYDMKVSYQNGVALLEGYVPSNAQRAQAAAVASEVPGVRSVANRLQVTEEEQIPDQAELRQAGYDPRMGPDPRMAQAGGYDPRLGPPPGYDPRMAMGPGPGGMMDPRMAMMANGVDPRMIPTGYQNGAPVPPPAPYAQAGFGMTPAGYTMPNMPEHAWPSYAQYPNSAAVTYPQQYSASAWPYIGPFYPYPQVPLGWRDATLRWDDGQWNLQFRQRTDKWFWFLHPKNW
jgi:osmotically-inducible protein OsmY